MTTTCSSYAGGSTASTRPLRNRTLLTGLTQSAVQFTRRHATSSVTGSRPVIEESRMSIAQRTAQTT